MLKRRADRRSVMIAGAAVLAVASGTVAAQSVDIRGALAFSGGAAIPPGLVLIALEDPAIPDRARRRVAQTRIISDGASKMLDFFLPLPATTAMSSSLQIVARLERADGWLLARGSARVNESSPTTVTLSEAVY
jgi:uncharacterized lipoprotein YbaY